MVSTAGTPPAMVRKGWSGGLDCGDPAGYGKKGVVGWSRLRGPSSKANRQNTPARLRGPSSKANRQNTPAKRTDKSTTAILRQKHHSYTKTEAPQACLLNRGRSCPEASRQNVMTRLLQRAKKHEEEVDDDRTCLQTTKQLSKMVLNASDGPMCVFYGM